MSVLDGIDAVVFDVDGTLLHSDDPGGVRGARPIAGRGRDGARVRATGRRLLFFTNGTGRPPAQYAADLRAVGFELADDEFMNPPSSPPAGSRAAIRESPCSCSAAPASSRRCTTSASRRSRGLPMWSWSGGTTRSATRSYERRANTVAELPFE